MTLTLTKTRLKTLTDEQAADVRRDWERDTAALADDVQAWAEAAGRGWRVERTEREVIEESIGGSYRVPVVTIRAGEYSELVLEPAARALLSFQKGQGRVDLYAYPSMYRVMLMHREVGKGRPLEWVVRTSSGLDWPQPWDRETFLRLADGLLAA